MCSIVGVNRSKSASGSKHDQGWLRLGALFSLARWIAHLPRSYVPRLVDGRIFELDAEKVNNLVSLVSPTDDSGTYWALSGLAPVWSLDITTEYLDPGLTSVITTGVLVFSTKGLRRASLLVHHMESGQNDSSRSTRKDSSFLELSHCYYSKSH